MPSELDIVRWQMRAYLANRIERKEAGIDGEATLQRMTQPEADLITDWLEVLTKLDAAERRAAFDQPGEAVFAQKVWMEVECPTCGVQPGTPCFDLTDDFVAFRRAVHESRKVARNKNSEERIEGHQAQVAVMDETTSLKRTIPKPLYAVNQRVHVESGAIEGCGGLASFNGNVATLAWNGVNWTYWVRRGILPGSVWNGRPSGSMADSLWNESNLSPVTDPHILKDITVQQYKDGQEQVLLWSCTCGKTGHTSRGFEREDIQAKARSRHAQHVRRAKAL
jgi:hypothetical protein